jgi:FMN phosphatase YigB (HAD superfamily)
MQTILVDCDGVLADFAGGVCAALDALNPHPWRGAAKYTPERFTSYDVRKHLSEREQEQMQVACTSPGFAASLEWYAGAQAWLAALRPLGEIVCLTAPFTGAPTWVQERAAWLRGHVDQVHFCHAKEKAEVPGDLLIEDRYATCVAWTRKQGRQAILIDRPWNQGPDLDNVHRSTHGLPSVAVVRALLGAE